MNLSLLQQLNDRPGPSRVMHRGLAVNHGNLGGVYHYEGNYTRALESHQDYVAHRFNYAAALRQLGLVQRHRGASAEAITAFRRSIDVFASLAADQRDPKQRGAGAKENLHTEIDAVAAALAQVERSLGTR